MHPFSRELACQVSAVQLLQLGLPVNPSSSAAQGKFFSLRIQTYL
jgi:hypothetical protein